jgi:hypothetical protein
MVSQYLPLSEFEPSANRESVCKSAVMTGPRND